MRREKKRGAASNFAPNWLDRAGTAVIVPATFRPSARNDSTGERCPDGCRASGQVGEPAARPVVHAVKGDAGYAPSVHRGSLARGRGGAGRAGRRAGPA